MRQPALIIFAMTSATFIAMASGQTSKLPGNPGMTEKEQKIKEDTVKPAPQKNTVTHKTIENKTTDDFSFLKKFNGKYPYEVKLLDKPVLVKRLKKLLGDRFLFLKKTWAVETPIEIKNNIFVASACEAHNCDMTNFMIVIDISRNVVSAGIREEQQVKLYSEDKAGTPQQLQDWANGK